MKRFHFRLEHLLGLRERFEELAKLDLGKASRLTEEIRADIARISYDQRTAGWGDFDPVSLQARQAWLSRLAHDKRRKEKDLEAAEIKRAEVLREFTRKSQEAEVLRKLKNRRSDEYRLDKVRHEDAQLDDLVVSRLYSGTSPQEEADRWHD